VIEALKHAAKLAVSSPFFVEIVVRPEAVEILLGWRRELDRDVNVLHPKLRHAPGFVRQRVFVASWAAMRATKEVLSRSIRCSTTASWPKSAHSRGTSASGR
jgi:hypothetical protein